MIDDNVIKRYKDKSFSILSIYNLKNGESIVIFSRSGDEKVDYLRIKDRGKENEEIITAISIKPEEAYELLNVLNTKSDKINEFLEEIEGRYKRRKIFGII